MSQLKISVPNDMLQNQKIYVQSLKQQQILCPFIFPINSQEGIFKEFLQINKKNKWTKALLF